MEKIALKDIWPIPDATDFKLHFARFNQKREPLDVFARDPQEWRKWQEYRPSRDEFNRPFIFSLMQFYHEPDAWLFGGVWKVVDRHPDHYEVELTERGSGFIGRLKLGFRYANRSPRVNF